MSFVWEGVASFQSCLNSSPAIAPLRIPLASPTGRYSSFAGVRGELWWARGSSSARGGSAGAG